MPDSLCVIFEAENFTLGFQPVVERSALALAALGMKLIGPLSNTDLEVVAGRNRLTVQRLLFRDSNSRFLLLDRSGNLPLARFFRGMGLHDSRSPFSLRCLRRGVAGGLPARPRIGRDFSASV